MYYLYLKTHSVTGLKYLGQTIAENPYKYSGSGKRWVNHLKKHGYSMNTSILLKTESAEELKETGIFFSKLFNVVESDEWANLKEESGDGGWDHIRNDKDYRTWCSKGGKNSPPFPKYLWFTRGSERTKQLSKLANDAKTKRIRTDPDYKKQYYDKVSKYQTENNSMKNRHWCVPINCVSKSAEMKVFHKDEIPEGWLTCLDFNESKKNKTNPAYGKMWIYNQTLKMNKYIGKQELIPEGWEKGRKMKF